MSFTDASHLPFLPFFTEPLSLAQDIFDWHVEYRVLLFASFPSPHSYLTYLPPQYPSPPAFPPFLAAPSTPLPPRFTGSSLLPNTAPVPFLITFFSGSLHPIFWPWDGVSPRYLKFVVWSIWEFPYPFFNFTFCLSFYWLTRDWENRGFRDCVFCW